MDVFSLLAVPVLQQESGAVSYHNLVRDRADKTGVWFYGELAGERKCTVLWHFNICCPILRPRTKCYLQVADLATFLLITIFPQTPFVLYFAYIQPVIFPVDPIVGTLMLLYLVSLTVRTFGTTAPISTHHSPFFPYNSKLLYFVCLHTDIPLLCRVASLAADYS